MSSSPQGRSSDHSGVAPQAAGASQQRGARRLLGRARWYVASVMGDNHYERYLAHHAAAHPGEIPMTKREYWRERTDAQERNPGARCC